MHLDLDDAQYVRTLDKLVQQFDNHRKKCDKLKPKKCLVIRFFSCYYTFFLEYNFRQVYF